MNRFLAPLPAILALVLFAGCSEGGPETYPVTGKVTINGQPASGLQIQFNPVEPGKEAASGNISADGGYTLYTGVEGKEGAPPGKYKVTLSDPSDTSYMQSGGGDPTTIKGGKVPADYRTVTTSPKVVEVTAGPNTINIEI
jgi:hypothetical protein